MQAAWPELWLYLPDTHSRHEQPFDPKKPASHTQLFTAAAPTGDDEPEGHERHVAAEVAAWIVEYVPLGQAKQPSDPCRALYVPAEHLVHDPASRPVQPVLQEQALEAVLCKGELELDGQLSHIEDPALDLYLPTLHFMHAPPLGPDEPVLHVQAVEAVLCAGELE